jgi:N-acetyl-gamma-glutamyl-phosphate reductase
MDASGWPQVRVVTANAFAGQHLGDVYPHLAPFARKNGLGPMCKMDEVDWSGIDVAFTCLPHAITQKAVVALPSDLKIVDLSADFRLRDAVVYEKWYDTPHEAPEHLAEAGESQR